MRAKASRSSDSVNTRQVHGIAGRPSTYAADEERRDGNYELASSMWIPAAALEQMPVTLACLSKWTDGIGVHHDDCICTCSIGAKRVPLCSAAGPPRLEFRSCWVYQFITTSTFLMIVICFICIK